MITLVLIGFLGGLVTGISPCILPVVPVIFAAGAASGLEDDPTAPGVSGPADGADADDQQAESSAQPTPVAVGAASPGSGGASPGPAVASPRPAGSAPRAVAPRAAPATSLRAHRQRLRRQRRPVAVVGGLVLSFAVFTLVGSWLLTLLGLPQDLLHWIWAGGPRPGGAGPDRPPVGDCWGDRSPGWPECPYSGPTPEASSSGSASVWSSCRAPVPSWRRSPWSAPTTTIGFSSIVLTASFALGIAVPLLVFAVLGSAWPSGCHSVRARAAAARKGMGVVLGAHRPGHRA